MVATVSGRRAVVFLSGDVKADILLAILAAGRRRSCDSYWLGSSSSINICSRKAGFAGTPETLRMKGLSS